MKVRIVSGLCFIMFLLSILPNAAHWADANQSAFFVPVSFPQAGFFPMSPYIANYPRPSFPYASRLPLISAQQACLQNGGWNWRQGQVPMCFKSGHDVCPSGHPGMRQMTQRYTICLSAESLEPYPPVMGIQ